LPVATVCPILKLSFARVFCTVEGSELSESFALLLVFADEWSSGAPVIGARDLLLCQFPHQPVRPNDPVLVASMIFANAIGCWDCKEADSSRRGEPQIPPLRFAPVGMTNGTHQGELEI
jgi:hypothetical protein